MKKSQITSTKLQISTKSQAPNSKLFGILNFEHWNLFGSKVNVFTFDGRSPGICREGKCWNLRFGICRAERGFTLIELVVYIGILAVVALVVTNSILILNRTLASFRLERRVISSGETAMRRITRELRLANDIHASSTLGVSPGVLSLASQESEEDSTAKDVMIYVSGGELILRRATSSAAALTASGVTVTNLTFRQITNGTVSKAVKVELTLSSSAGSASTTKNYYTTAGLRGSY